MSAAPTKPAPSALAIDVIVDCRLWQAEHGVDAMVRRAIAQAAAMASTTNGELAVLLTDDAAIRALNRDWRGKDEPTNVLSFPAKEARPRGDAPRMLGDIVIAYQTTAREAAAEGKPLLHHLAHLAVHGYLHLVGYDHAADAEADAMEGLEAAILVGLGVPNPYPTRAAAKAAL
jgi:probable rRNA maturation factor